MARTEVVGWFAFFRISLAVLVQTKGCERSFQPSMKARRLVLGPWTRLALGPPKRGRSCSKGDRQKMTLVAAFAMDTDLLVPDEPTSGLDPLMEQVFNECVAEHTARGATVLLPVTS